MATNWTLIESEYVTGTMSYRELAADRGLSIARVKEHGRTGEWNRKRKEYRADCTARTADKAAETVADRMAGLKETVLQNALELARRLNKQLDEADHLKPAEMLQYARVLAALNDYLKSDKAVDMDTSTCGIVILPARTNIDPPPDDYE